MSTGTQHVCRSSEEEGGCGPQFSVSELLGLGRGPAIASPSSLEGRAIRSQLSWGGQLPAVEVFQNVGYMDASMLAHECW